ncbi:hypothetical protein [Granulicella sibirica]|uniref:DUF4239 domain-containing protein n=1 Tax=Granulicella sibirica TaxID=2479048 RepID=A0A4V1L5P6_9BACT|nr:hypothetical protein [Granulicella sibirica]RXH56494.1 hypothetical protein GRAN_3351 [Granulicella sibirica]
MISYMVNHPRVLAVVLLLILWGMSLLGTWLRTLYRPSNGEDMDDTALVISAALTLLGLIIGFTFSMATTRYDLRRQYEEGEANALGTEWVRCDLMPPSDGAKTRALLLRYLDARIAFYDSDYGDTLDAVRASSAALQQELWLSVVPTAAAQPTPISALVVNGMNDVLNSEGYTQSAWWNRIPTPAWALLIIIACIANVLVGYGTRQTRSGTLLLVVLPVLVSVAMFLIADIDSPRGGLIRVHPRDLMSLRGSLSK